MRRCCAIAVTVAALTSAAPVLAQSQLALSAGLTKEQAQGMSLDEIAAVKSNRGESPQDQHLAGARRVPGSEPALQAFAIDKYNAGKSRADRIVVREPRSVTRMAFQDPVDVSTHYQLIRAAGFTPEEAEGMSLNQILHEGRHGIQRDD